MKQAQDYRAKLKAELAARCKANPGYSLRAFARDLTFSPQRLSDILNGHQGLSLESAKRIAARLNLSSREAQKFCDQVESLHARSQVKRDLAARRLALSSVDVLESRALSLDSFQVISDWYHYALMELTRTAGFKNDIDWISVRLGLPQSTVSAGMERLKRLEILEEVKGLLRPTKGFVFSPSDIPSDAIKSFHRQVMEKALNAMSACSIDERDFSAVTMAINSSRMAEAKAEIKKFRRKFSNRLESGGDKDSVYCLSVQFFELTSKTQSGEMK